MWIVLSDGKTDRVFSSRNIVKLTTGEMTSEELEEFLQVRVGCMVRELTEDGVSQEIALRTARETVTHLYQTGGYQARDEKVLSRRLETQRKAVSLGYC